MFIHYVFIGVLFTHYSGEFIIIYLLPVYYLLLCVDSLNIDLLLFFCVCVYLFVIIDYERTCPGISDRMVSYMLDVDVVTVVAGLDFFSSSFNRSFSLSTTSLSMRFWPGSRLYVVGTASCKGRKMPLNTVIQDQPIIYH